ncbi:MAG: tetratricopeptide repeat protein [Caulobacteraceae bacterium]|nr:tetratricopeptide repeat protein [Caulobacteraceae bacterium]
MASPTFDERVGSVASALAHAGGLLASRPDLAEAQAREILRVAPGHPDALMLLAGALRRGGDALGARNILLTLAVSHARSPAVRMELGMAHASLGSTLEALEALTEVTRLDPDSPLAWHALGDQRLIIGDMAGAEAAQGRWVRGSIDDPLLLDGARALFDGRMDVAEQVLRDQLNLHPTDVAAGRMLADAAIRLGRLGDAEQLLVRGLETAPGFMPARYNYAIVLHRQQRTAEAMTQVELLLRQAPGTVAFRNLRAALLAQTGDFAGALEDFEAVLDNNPDQPGIWLSYGHALKTIGRRGDAVTAYRQALTLQPDFGEAYWSLANLKTVRFTEVDIEAMKRQLAAPDLSHEDRTYLHFALGKGLEDAGALESSFKQYALGNAARRTTAPYDAEGNANYVRRTIATFGEGFLEARAGVGAAAADPIFVLGLPRSGSTLIEQILASHSAVEGTMELLDLTAVARRAAVGGLGGAPAFPESLAALPLADFATLGEDYLERTRVQRRLGRPFFIDKFPSNFMHVGLIHLILPKARIIDARRHPLGCGLSLFKQHFAQGQNYSYDLGDIGRHYADYVALMAHFDAVLPGRVHRVIYEEMVRDPEGEVRRLLDYCGLPFEPQCLRFHETDRAVRTASSEQVRRPIFTDGVDHWRGFEPWLGPLKDALGPVLDAYPAAPAQRS